MATGYAGGHHYVNQRAVVDGDLITAGPQSPVQFPTLQRCGAGAWQRIPSSRRTRELDRADTTAYPALMDAQDAA